MTEEIESSAKSTKKICKCPFTKKQLQAAYDIVSREDTDCEEYENSEQTLKQFTDWMEKNNKFKLMGFTCGFIPEYDFNVILSKDKYLEYLDCVAEAAVEQGYRIVKKYFTVGDLMGSAFDSDGNFARECGDVGWKLTEHNLCIL